MPLENCTNTDSFYQVFRINLHRKLLQILCGEGGESLCEFEKTLGFNFAKNLLRERFEFLNVIGQGEGAAPSG